MADVRQALPRLRRRQEVVIPGTPASPERRRREERVSTPVKAPARMPGRLTAKDRHIRKHAGSQEAERGAQAPGHHNASATPPGWRSCTSTVLPSRTNRMICRGSAPRQRSIPKNSVLLAILLFRLLAIISTPAVSTKRKRTTAARYSPSM